MHKLIPVVEDSPLFHEGPQGPDINLRSPDGSGTINVKSLQRNIHALGSHIEPVSVKPFTDYRDILSTLFRSAHGTIAHAALGTDRRMHSLVINQTGDLLLRAHLVCKTSETQQRIERILLTSAQEGVINPRETRIQLDELRMFLARRQIQPHRVIKPLIPVFLQLMGHVAYLQDYLDPRVVTPKERNKDEFFARAKELDFNKIAKQFTLAD